MLSTIMMDVAALAVCAFSPSKCRVRVSSTRYRHDPYRAKIIPMASLYELVQAAPRAVEAPVQASFVPAYAASIPTAPPSPKTVPKPIVSVSVAAPSTSPSAGPMKYALVGFKHEAVMYQAPFRVNVGDLVVVEADRGEHFGVVQDISAVAPKYNVPCRIIRRATAADKATAENLHARELNVTASVQKLSESLGLGIKVIDTEFQMDGNKMTVFFSSKCFVDFRKLQRSLFREFRCRIWLVNWAEVRTYNKVQATA